MRIIKVIHDGTGKDSKVDLERERMALGSFDFDEFWSKHQELWYVEARPLNGLPSAVAQPPGIFGLVSLIATYSPTHTSNVSYASSILKAALDDILKADVPDVLGLEAARRQFPRTSQLSTGTYTLHPRDPRQLVSLESFYRALALEKDDELVLLLQQMGAKEVQIIERTSTQRAGGASVGAGATGMGASAEAGFKAGREQDAGRELVVTFPGSRVDIPRDLLSRSRWFSDDSRMRTLLEARLHRSNPIKSYTITNTYAESFDLDFKLAARWIVAGVDLQAEYEQLSRIEKSFHVIFGEPPRQDPN